MYAKLVHRDGQLVQESHTPKSNTHSVFWQALAESMGEASRVVILLAWAGGLVVIFVLMRLSRLGPNMKTEHWRAVLKVGWWCWCGSGGCAEGLPSPLPPPPPKICLRKMFHIFAALLFVPPAILEPRLLSLAYAVATALLVVVEGVRLCKEWMPLGRLVDACWSTYVDARETGPDGKGGVVVVLTPIYLLVGCAVPHWVSGEGREAGGGGFSVTIARGYSTNACLYLGARPVSSRC